MNAYELVEKMNAEGMRDVVKEILHNYPEDYELWGDVIEPWAKNSGFLAEDD